jgi:ABC-type cobalamin transport system permease subunit
MSEDKSKRLRVFRFWLIGVFMIILAAYITIGFVFPDSLLLRELNYWLGIIFTAVLFAVWYFGYKFWLGRE